MNKFLILDAETTFQIEDGKKNPSPYHPNNRLVSVGYRAYNGNADYLYFYHTERGPTINGHTILQNVLDDTTLLVGHNLKFDLAWLRESGFNYDGDIWDTMVVEYVLARGRKYDLGLDDCCLRYNIAGKDKSIQEYLDKNISFDRIPEQIVTRYGRRDIEATLALFAIQAYNLLGFRTRLSTYPTDTQQIPASPLLPTILMSNEFTKVLVDMERRGAKIDREALGKIREGYNQELADIQKKLDTIKIQVIGDTPVNFDSPEQLSEFIYSRRVKDKKRWIELFNLGNDVRGAVSKRRKPKRLKGKDFINAIKENTEWIYKTKIEVCPQCNGKGIIDVLNKDGRLSKRSKICSGCKRAGVLFISTGNIGGLKQVPTESNFVTASGFATDHKTLEKLSQNAKNSGSEFLRAVSRRNAITTYLSSFVDGIERNLTKENILHTNFMQCVTATGRLSSRNPNLQNQPRGKTFPVRRVFISRFPDGQITEGDFSRLEFVTAVEMANDQQGKEDIANGVDIHSFTAKVLTESGQPTDRYGAKAHTFKPLYGGTTGTSAETAYYAAFLKKYKGIDRWQRRLQDQAIETKTIRLPSGREYSFPDAKRLYNGSSSFSTQIKNYPVQGFATADIVPCAIIDLENEFQRLKLQSLLFLTVHDSIAADTHPDELHIVPVIMKQVLENVRTTLKRRYGYDFSIPLSVEIKQGSNLLEAKEIKI